MNIPREFYTPKALFSLGGASGAVVLTSGTFGYVFDFNPKWLGLFVAQVISFAGIAFLPKDGSRHSSSLVAVAFFNGLLIYSQAVGLNTLNHAVPTPKTKQAVLVPVVDPVPWWLPANQQRAAEETAAILNEVANALASVRELAATPSYGEERPIGPSLEERVVLEKNLMQLRGEVAKSQNDVKVAVEKLETAFTFGGGTFGGKGGGGQW